MIVDLMNLNNGINNRRLETIVDSEYDGNLTASIYRLSQNQNLLAFIGTTSYINNIFRKEEKDEIAQALVDTDKLLFSPHLSSAGVTYQNIIQISFIYYIYYS